MTIGAPGRHRAGLQAIILDWAGTVVDYGCHAPAVVFVEVFRRFGVPITIEEARVPMGTNKKVHIRRLTELEAVRARWEATLGTSPSEADVDAMFEAAIPLQLDVLAEYADLIPGTLEAVDAFRARGLKVGSTTGYPREVMDALAAEAKARGYEPDAIVCATDVPAGRPEPWMCVQNAMVLRVYPFEACVKVDDTLPGIEEGLNAGMWTIGLALTGNEIGLNGDEVAALDPGVRTERLEAVRRRFEDGGAHYVVDGIWDVPAVLDEIEARLTAGGRP